MQLPSPRRLSAATRIAYRLVVTLSLLATCTTSIAACQPARAQPPALPAKPKAKAAKKPAPPVGPSVQANATSPLGTNLDGINDWSTEWAFVDAMKRSRDWISSPTDRWEDQRKFTFDDTGSPRSLAKGQRARALIFWETPHWPAGDYVVTYQGTGTLQFDPQNDVRSKKAGREVLHFDPKKGNVGLLITAMGSGDAYLHDLHVVMPGGVCANDPVRYCDFKAPCAGEAQCVSFESNHQAQIFHPTFLERVQHYSTVRFMDWMKTNESKEHKWADRPKPTDVRWNHGTPLEVMVALANRLSQNPWFNIPHAADDEYVRHFATYVRDNLRPELKAHVEYSNEVWNGIFPQAQYAIEQGKKLGMGPRDWDAQWRFYARRATEIHKIWEQVFKGQQQRVVRIIATQVSNAGVAESILGFEDTKQHVDALAVAPYFGGEYGNPDEYKKWENASVTDIIEDTRTRSIPNALNWAKTHAGIAQKYGIEMIGYEGGESYQGLGEAMNNERLNKLFDMVGRDPRMKELYLQYLRGWKDVGGKLFCHFTDVFAPGKYGRWGSLEYLDQPRKDAPKFDALQTFIEQTPRWW